MMFTLQNTPLSILNRALDLYGQGEEENTKEAWDALNSAQGRIDVHCPSIDGARITPFAQAVAEYLSCSGPWDTETGYIENEGDFRTITGER